jgi:tetratricopeptide (TPR) repeat protein
MDGLIETGYCQSIKFTKNIISQESEFKREYIRKYPREGDLCIIFCKNLTSLSLDVTQVGLELDTNITIKIGVFTTEISRILQIAIQTAKLGELFEVSFELNEDLAYNRFSNSSKKITVDLKFQIKLIEISYFEKPIFKYDLSDMLTSAKLHKNDATELFKANNVLTAFYRYKKSFDYLTIAEQSTQYGETDEKKQIGMLKSQVYNNMAACQLKYLSDNYEHVIKNCTKCLEYDHNNSKALYRRSMAYIEEKRYDRATNDLERALKIEPGNNLFKEKIAIIEQLKLKAR